MIPSLGSIFLCEITHLSLARLLPADLTPPFPAQRMCSLYHAPPQPTMKPQPQRLSSSSALTSACVHADEALTPILPILEAFNHRHKNQHRASHWWAEFGILRRSLRALASDALHRHGSALLSRAQWLKSHIIPRSYLAFTQLAADNQHAPLGLLLLALLARVNAIVSDLLPEAAPPPNLEVKDVSSCDVAPEDSTTLDKGTVVSREDLMALRRDKPSSKVKPSIPEIKSMTSFDSPPRKIEKKKTKKKPSTKKGDDEWSSLFGKLN
ncbi:Ribonuclease MRP protein subunit rmp1 [Paramyrothecium foliicola]|nr:Ribonuclease MRP protein subunit rmp1 [Paramyrothecium foliicola]